MAAFRRLRGTREASLFSALVASDTLAGERLVPGDDAFRLLRGWLSRDAADALFTRLRAATHWIAERRMMYDRIVDVPREQAWHGDGCDLAWTPQLAAVRDDLEPVARTRFDYVLLNRYRDGNDSVAWHNDRFPVRAAEPIVASLTLGATRAFDVRAKAARSRIFSTDLDHGDLVIMGAGAQLDYEHRVPKDRRIGGERINLTFRHALIGITDADDRSTAPNR